MADNTQETSRTYLKQADKKLGDIRELGAKPETRWFGVGPKKKLTQQDSMRQKLLSDNELTLRSKGMALKRMGR